MDKGAQVLVRMGNLLTAWEAANDKRVIFLSCYILMTENVLAAIQSEVFEDTPWVATLMENFAGYYFQALENFEKEPTSPPQVWQIAFHAAQNPHTHILQNLVLGVNAHINYDLVFALSELLASEWTQLSPEERHSRYLDHCHINEIIHNTINEVQVQVIERYQPLFRVVDELLSPVEEWMTTLMISEWRDEVWKHATHLIDTAEPTSRLDIIQQIHQLSLARAQDILGKGGISELAEFF